MNDLKKIFIVGIKGVAMANIAVILKKMGKQIAGSDIDDEFITDEVLKKNSITVTKGFDPQDISQDIDLVLFGPAHGGSSNRQVVEAKKRSIKTLTQAEFLGQFLKEFKTTIAVCGSHGKTTTASLLSYALLNLKTNPSYLVGTSSFRSKDHEFTGGDFNGNDYFVIEADEYGVNPPTDKTPKFLKLNPDFVLCTNIDFDHPDIYKDISEVKGTFLKFFKEKKKVCICADDKNSLEVSCKLSKEQVETYGFSAQADARITEFHTKGDYSEFNLTYKAETIYVCLGLFGEKNISNAAGVILTLINLGFSLQEGAGAVEWFTGTKRRFERVGEVNGVLLYDDYAHHPSEIEATIKAARRAFPTRRIVVIFQPHTYSRTQALFREFGQALSEADSVLVAPIFPSARENREDFNVTSDDIASNSTKPASIQTIDSIEETPAKLASIIQKDDVVFTMGAGDIYKLKNDIIGVLEKAL